MNDMRRTLLWVIFTMSLVLIWDAWQKHTGHASIFGGSTRSVATAPASPAAPGAASAVGVPVAAAVPTAVGAAAPLAVPVTAALPPVGEQITITTDLGFNPNAPANWPDYLGFIAAWVWIAYACATNLRKPSHHGWMIIFIIATLLVSQNNTARNIIFFTLIGTSIALFLQATRRLPAFLVPKRNWRCLAVIGCLVPIVWVAFSMNQDKFHCKNSTVGERAGFNQTAINAIKHDPARLLFGNGWNNLLLPWKMMNIVLMRNMVLWLSQVQSQ